MKKFLSIAAALVLGISLFAEAPVYDKGEAFIIDTRDYSTSPAYSMKCINISFNFDFNIKVEAWDDSASKWVDFASGSLKRAGDSDKLKLADWKYKFNKTTYRYFAVTNDSGKSFKYMVKQPGSELKIWFLDDTEIDDSKSFTVDVDSLSGDFKAALKMTGDSNLKYLYTFDVYGWNTEGDTPVYVTPAVLQGSDDTDTYFNNVDEKRLNTFRYYKVVNRQKKDLAYKAEIKYGDLVITVAQR